MKINQETKEKIATGLGNFSRGFMKSYIKVHVSPRVDDLEKEGFGEEQFKQMVQSNLSFYDNVMPKSWKQGLLKLARNNKSQWDAVKEDRSFEYLFMETLGEVRSWLPQVIGRAYFENEFSKFRRDVDGS